jgi:hypothetical protein
MMNLERALAKVLRGAAGLSYCLTVDYISLKYSSPPVLVYN